MHCAAPADEPDRTRTRRRSAHYKRHRAHAPMRRTLARLPARIWSVHHHLQSLQSLGQARTLAGDLRGIGRLRKEQRDLVDRLHLDQGASLGERRKRGEHEQAIGRSRGGRTTKIHALSDPDCRPCAFHLTPGQDADIAATPALLALAPPMSALIADKGYDGDGFRADVISRGARPVIPNKSNRMALHRFNKRAYRGRNVIERCFCRLKDFRRIATRYDKLARNFLAAIQLAALVAYWIN